MLENSFDVFFTDNADYRSILSIAPIVRMRRELRSWDTTDSDVADCTRLVNPQVLSSCSEFSPIDVTMPNFKHNCGGLQITVASNERRGLRIRLIIVNAQNFKIDQVRHS